MANLHGLRRDDDDNRTHLGRGKSISEANWELFGRALINYRCTPMIVDRFFRILIIGFMVNWMRA